VDLVNDHYYLTFVSLEQLQDADIVSFLYRPEYYKIDEWDDEASPTAGQAEIMIAKHRSIENVRLNSLVI
jgi:replicative DNA helicase